MASAPERRRSVRINSKKLVVFSPPTPNAISAVDQDLDEKYGGDYKSASPPPSKKRKPHIPLKPAVKNKPSPGKKAKRADALKEVPGGKKAKGIDVVKDISMGKSRKQEDSGNDTEKRLRRFRTHPPVSFEAIADRALTQRLCVLDRKRTGTPEQPEETIEIAGSTGNIYTVRINKVPSCDCPHALKGHQCKHIIYVMRRTLRAPDDIAYQLALLSTELAQVFATAPPIPTEKGEADAQAAPDDPNRKEVADECPICCVDFDPANDDIIWCKAACGNNVHRSCFQTWAGMKKAQHAKVTCPFCRTEWHDDEVSTSVKIGDAKMGEDGYLNVASQLGLSGKRDYSSYHQFWVRKQRYEAGGYLSDEEDAFDEY